MYIHVGDNEILKSKDIIGFFDTNVLKQSRSNLRIINMLKNHDDNVKSVIITNSDEKFSIISTRTLKSRVDKYKNSVLIKNN